MLAVGFELATFGTSAAGSFSMVDDVEDIRSGPSDFTFGVRYVCVTMMKSSDRINSNKAYSSNLESFNFTRFFTSEPDAETTGDVT